MCLLALLFHYLAVYNAALAMDQLEYISPVRIECWISVVYYIARFRRSDDWCRGLLTSWKKYVNYVKRLAAPLVI